MQCSYFDAGLCRSCTLMGVPYAAQLAEKQRSMRELLAGHPDAVWSPAAASAESGFRAKAKMVVGGTAAEPTLGVLDGRGRGVDLRHCGIIAPGIRAAFAPLITTITAAGLEPYDVPARRGELKYLIVTEAADGGLMARFVLRSRARLDALRRALPSLQQALPRAVVVTANLHPDHKAVVEGAEEIVLTEQQTLPMRVGDATLQVRPQSFVQTNTAIAGELYRQGREWVERVAPSSVWDLYCGVGGFALHVAAPGRVVTGLELSADAVASARLAAEGMPGLTFVVGDATAALAGGLPGGASSASGAASPLVGGHPGDAASPLAGAALPDLVIVNPPRRGLGVALATGLESSGIPTIVYSSCNATTLARDLQLMPAYRVREARLFDMFPQSTHAEVMVLLERR